MPLTQSFPSGSILLVRFPAQSCIVLYGNISQAMGTYETSILHYEDCCTVFLPENPVTRPTIAKAEEEENNIPNYEELLRSAIDNLEILKID